MAEFETIEAISAFAHLAVPGRRDGGGGLVVAEHVGFGLASVTMRRGRREEFCAAIAGRFGIALEAGAKVSVGGDVMFIGTGPGSWLAMKRSGGWRFADELRAALGETAAVCDQSSGYGVLRLSGPCVREVLAKGVPIDLDPVVFVPGDAAVTLASHVGIVLWRVDRGRADEAPAFDIAVSRSFVGSFWHWLEASAATVGLSVTGEVAPLPEP